MRPIAAFLLVIALASTTPLAGQSGPATTSAEPFKLGTFEINGDRRVGIVLRDKLVVELHDANRALERSPTYPRLPMPADMLELISRYEYGIKYRLYEIVNDLVAKNLLTEGKRPGYVHEVAKIRTLAPILYPGKILNAGGNFYTHLAENNTPELQQKAIEQRRANRGIPYLFLKPSEGSPSLVTTMLLCFLTAAIESTGKWSYPPCSAAQQGTCRQQKLRTTYSDTWS